MDNIIQAFDTQGIPHDYHRSGNYMFVFVDRNATASQAGLTVLQLLAVMNFESFKGLDVTATGKLVFTYKS